MFDRVLNINGFDVHARYTQGTIERVFDPICVRLSDMYKVAARPQIALLTAPPGAGKSTLAHALGVHAAQEGLSPITALGMDGFHFNNKYLRTHNDESGRTLSSIKGAPSTYDLDKLLCAIEQLHTGKCIWPIYDRTAHEPSPEPMHVSGSIFIVEGNWLMLDAPWWRDLKGMCDISIGIDADEDLLMPRLIARKIHGGMNESAAREFCMRSDLDNIRLYKSRKLPCDIELRQEQSCFAVELIPLSGL